MPSPSNGRLFQPPRRPVLASRRSTERSTRCAAIGTLSTSSPVPRGREALALPEQEVHLCAARHHNPRPVSGWALRKTPGTSSVDSLIPQVCQDRCREWCHHDTFTDQETDDCSLVHLAA